MASKAAPTEGLPPDEKFSQIMAQIEEDIPSQLKWQASFNKKHELKDPESIKANFVSKVKGIVAERFGMALELDEATTVYKSKAAEQAPPLLVRSAQDTFGQKTKDNVLEMMVAKSLDEAPTANLERLIEEQNPKYPAEIKAQTREQIVAGYGSKGAGKKSPAGMFYQDTVMPDGLLLTKSEWAQEEGLVGFVEVKSYTPEEVKAMRREIERKIAESEGKGSFTKAEVTMPVAGKDVLMNLGVDLPKEEAFVDIVRTTGFAQPKLWEQQVVLLRFPNDVADEDLIWYGQQTERYGYPNVIIQKLPFSTTELAEIGSGVMKHVLPAIDSGKGMEFSRKEIEILHELYD